MSIKKKLLGLLVLEQIFLSGKPTSIHALGVIERMPESKNNAFFWRYEGKNYFYKKGIYEAVESNVNIEYIQNIK